MAISIQAPDFQPPPKAHVTQLPKGLPTNGLVGMYVFEERQNLFSFSQQMDNSIWAKSRSTITANCAIAPDGTWTADRLVENNELNAPHRIMRAFTFTAGVTYTMSIYLKKGSRDHMLVGYLRGITIRGAKFDVGAGIVHSQDNESNGVTNVTMKYCGNGWYRCRITFIPDSTGTTVYFQMTDQSGNYYIDGDPVANAKGIYMWGIQLNEGAELLPYFPTNDKQFVMDYSKPRKNLLLPNQANACEDGTTFGFSAYSGATISASTEQAWQGSRSLKLVTPNVSAYEGMLSQVFEIKKASQDYTFSVYARGAVGGETIKVAIYFYPAIGGTQHLNKIVTVAALTTSWTRHSVTLKSLDNSVSFVCAVYTASKQAATYYIDGLQFEEGTSATAWEAPPNVMVCGTGIAADTADPIYNGQGAYFTTNDTIMYPPFNFANNQGFTVIVGFAYTTQTLTRMNLVLNLDGNNPPYPGFGLMLSRTTAGKVDFYIGAYAANFGASLNDGAYHLITAVCNGDGSVSVAIDNGTPDVRTGIVQNTAIVQPTTARLGSSYSDQYLTGTIPIYLVYNRVLTPTEKLQAYNSLKAYGATYGLLFP